MTQRPLAGATSVAGARAPASDPPAQEGGLDSLYVRGVALWNGGRRQEAIAALDAALRRDPNFPEALCMGGYILADLGKREAALEFYRRALGLKVDLPVAWSNVGKLMFEDERYAEALDSFDAALGLTPKDADLWNSRAGALRKLGRLEDSAAAAREALRLQAAIRRSGAQSRHRLAQARSRRRRACGLRSRRARRSRATTGRSTARRWRCARLAASTKRATRSRRAVRLGNVEAISGLGCLDLTLGDFERGWEGYEARWVEGKSLAEALGARFPPGAAPAAPASGCW